MSASPFINLIVWPTTFGYHYLCLVYFDIWDKMATYIRDTLHQDSRTRPLVNCGNSCYINACIQALFTCDICGQGQPASEFTQRRRSSIYRCRSCSQQFSECGIACTTAIMFATGSSKCWLCYKGDRACEVCLNAFSSRELQGTRENGRTSISRLPGLLVLRLHAL